MDSISLSQFFDQRIGTVPDSFVDPAKLAESLMALALNPDTSRESRVRNAAAYAYLGSALNEAAQNGQESFNALADVVMNYLSAADQSRDPKNDAGHDVAAFVMRTSIADMRKKYSIAAPAPRQGMEPEVLAT